MQRRFGGTAIDFVDMELHPALLYGCNYVPVS